MCESLRQGHLNTKDWAEWLAGGQGEERRGEPSEGLTADAEAQARAFMSGRRVGRLVEGAGGSDGGVDKINTLERNKTNRAGSASRLHHVSGSQH